MDGHEARCPGLLLNRADSAGGGGREQRKQGEDGASSTDAHEDRTIPGAAQQLFSSPCPLSGRSPQPLIVHQWAWVQSASWHEPECGALDPPLRAIIFQVKSGEVHEGFFRGLRSIKITLGGWSCGWLPGNNGGLMAAMGMKSLFLGFTNSCHNSYLSESPQWPAGSRVPQITGPEPLLGSADHSEDLLRQRQA